MTVFAEGETGCIMLVNPSGSDADSQWFDYVAEFYAEPVRYAWDKGTNVAVFPVASARLLIERGYARAMTDAEIKSYADGLVEDEKTQTKEAKS